MTGKLSLLDYSLQILNEINLPMNHLVCLDFFNLRKEIFDHGIRILLYQGFHKASDKINVPLSF